MKYLFTVILGCLLCSSSLLAQLDSQFRRDSIEIEKGIEGTSDFEPFFKVINEAFNQENQPLTSIVYRYESADELVPHQRQEFQYENGNTTSFTLGQWDEAGAQWVPVKQELSIYENDQITGFLRKKNVNGELVNSQRWTYTYENMKETERRLERWNADENSWEEVSRKTSTYNTDGKITSQLLEKFENGDWVNKKRRDWSWMPDNMQPVGTIVQVWDDTDQAWVNQIRKSYSMGTNGLWSGATIERWNAENNEWVNDIREANAFDFPGNSSTFAMQDWDGNAWAENIQARFSFSANQSNALLQRWNDASMENENFLRYQTENNNDLLPVRRTGMQLWNAETEAWENQDFSRRVTYFWSDANDTSIENLVSQDLCKVPNPYRAGTPIWCDIPTTAKQIQVEVVNLFGQVLYQKRVRSQNLSINANLIPGLYIIRILDGKNLYHQQKIYFSK